MRTNLIGHCKGRYYFPCLQRLARVSVLAGQCVLAQWPQPCDKQRRLEELKTIISKSIAGRKSVQCYRALSRDVIKMCVHDSLSASEHWILKRAKARERFWSKMVNFCCTHGCDRRSNRAMTSNFVGYQKCVRKKWIRAEFDPAKDSSEEHGELDQSTELEIADSSRKPWHRVCSSHFTTGQSLVLTFSFASESN